MPPAAPPLASMRLLSRLRGAALARVIVPPGLVREAPLRLRPPAALVRLMGPVAPRVLRLRSPLLWVIVALLKPVPRRPLPVSL